MNVPTPLSDDDYRDHWLRYHETVDWSAFTDMTDVELDTLVAPPKGSFMERLGIVCAKSGQLVNNGAQAKHFQETTRNGGLNSAHMRRQRYRDSLVANPFDITRTAAVDRTEKLHVTFGDVARFVRGTKREGPSIGEIVGHTLAPFGRRVGS